MDARCASTKLSRVKTIAVVDLAMADLVVVAITVTGTEDAAPPEEIATKP